MVNWLYRSETHPQDPFETTLSARIHEATFRNLVGQPLVAKARIVKDLGNKAAHEPRAVPFADASRRCASCSTSHIGWSRTYAKAAKPDAVGVFAGRPAAEHDDSGHDAGPTEEAAQRFAETVKTREEAEAKRLASEADRNARS